MRQMSNEAILKVVRMGIPSAGMPGFGKSLTEGQIQAVVQDLRALQGRENTTKPAGDGDHGGELFFGRAKCGECHMVNGRGGFLAGDLTGYGSGRSAESVREAIEFPNKNFNPRHGTISVTLISGQTYRGLIRNEDNFSLQMQTPDGTLHLLDKAELASIQREPNSLMPDDYRTRLKKAEIDDLVTFLSRGLGTKKTEEEEQ